jgi:hypothetical protein
MPYLLFVAFKKTRVKNKELHHINYGKKETEKASPSQFLSFLSIKNMSLRFVLG